jgi:hypothetical protein
MQTAIPNFSDFLREKVGRNWVLHPRTARIRQRYGADVVCLSKQQYRALEAEYDMLYCAPTRNLHSAAPALMEACKRALADKAEQYADTFDSRMDNDKTVMALRTALKLAGMP